MTPPARRRLPHAHPRFPLADWIDAHPAVPHHLAHSGMVGQLRSTIRFTRDPEPATEEELRARLARILGSPEERVFLTHGATEAYGSVLVAIGRARARRPGGAPPRIRVTLPEYPPLIRAAELLGFRPVGPDAPAEVAVFSEPNNPTGHRRGPRRLLEEAGQVPQIVVDETFREFTDAPSLARRSQTGLWVVGSMTKSYGADFLHVGYAVVPPEAVARFEELRGVLADVLPAGSAAGAAALLKRRATVLAEARGIFRANRNALESAVPGVPALAAPTWFDRGVDGLDGDRLTRAALRAGVLVAPGTLFGDRTGVRVCLTRRSFPKD
ncbi:MAG: aminotransferase class I/II-fold pyridoxal phosphate-dependent enzyme, partial [Thermoplasmata archaeon]